MNSKEAFSNFAEAFSQCCGSLSSFRIQTSGMCMAEALAERLRVFNPVVVERAFEAAAAGRKYKSNEECQTYMPDTLCGEDGCSEAYVLAAETDSTGTVFFAIAGGGDYVFRAVFSGRSAFIAVERSHRWGRSLIPAVLGFCVEHSLLEGMTAE